MAGPARVCKATVVVVTLLAVMAMFGWAHAQQITITVGRERHLRTSRRRSV